MTKHSETIENPGMRVYRVNDELNAEELRFARFWDAQQKHGYGLTEHLLSTDPERPGVGITPRDRQVAATIIQWLGTPVGQWFLRDMGYTRTK
jgi:hypothetical protein